MDKLLNAAKASEMPDLDSIYLCIPENERKMYGKTKEEQCANFIKENPKFFSEPEKEVIDLSTDDKVLDYIVLTLTRKIGLQNIAYKGGYILNKIIPNARKTYDVDLSIARVEQYEEVKRVLGEVGEYLVKAGAVISYNLKHDIKDTMTGGITFDRGNNEKLGVDVGLHPLGYGVEFMKLDFTDIQRFTLERSLADKVSVLCSPKRFRRVKDLYDVYMITSMFDIDGTAFAECKLHRNIDYTKEPTSEETIVQLKYAYDKLILNRDSSFIIEKPDFYIVYNRVLRFIKGTEDCDGSRWSCKEVSWSVSNNRRKCSN